MGATAVVIVKLVPATRALILVAPSDVVLQVTESRAPSESSSRMKTWLFAVTAVVFTCTVVAPAAITTLPAMAEAHAAGDALDAQT